MGARNMTATELYRWTAATPADSVVHGRGYVIGTATGEISFRRGLDISASFDTKAAISGSFGGSAAGVALSAQAEIKAGLQLQAKLPLDIFTAPGAGLVVRLSLGASAAASVAVVGTLDIGQLVEKLLPDFGGAWETLLPLIVDELDISIGVWAHVEVAAEVQAQAVAAVSILPSNDPAQPPGFTFQFSFRAGFMFGAGVSVVVNVGLLQPERMVARLGERLANVAVDGFDARAATISDAAAREAAYVAGALARVLIPLGLEGAYQVGVAAIAPTDRTQKATTATSDQLIHQAQLLVVRAVVQFGAKELSRVLNTSVVIDAMLLLDDPGVVLQPLTNVVAAVEALHTADSVTGAQFLTTVEAVIAAVEGVLDTPLLSSTRIDLVRRATAIAWCGAQLIQAVTTHAATPSLTDARQFRSTIAPLPDRGGALGKHIPHPGPHPTLGDIVAFLTTKVLSELEDEVPWAAQVGAWLGTALGVTGGGIPAVFGALFGTLLSPVSATADQIVAALSPAITEATTRLRDQALHPLIVASAGDPPLAALLNDIVDPLLDTIPVVVLPSLAQLHDDTAAERAREAMAAIVVQSLGKFIQDITLRLVEDAMGRESTGLSDKADDIGANGANSATYHELSQLGLGAMLTVSEAEKLLRITAAALWDADTAMHHALAVTSANSTAALTDATSRADHLRQLLHDDQLPTGVDLLAGCRQLTSSALVLGSEVIPPYLDFAAGWLGRRINDLADEGAHLAAQFITWAQGKIAELGADIATLGNQINYWIGQFDQAMGAIATLVSQLARAMKDELEMAIRNDLYARGDRLIDEIVPDLPHWREEARKTFHGLVDATLSVGESVLDLIYAAAAAAADALNAAAQSGQVSAAGMHNHVQATIYTSSRVHLASGLSVNGVPFPVTVTSADIAGATWSRVSKSAAYEKVITDGMQHAQDASNARGQRRNNEAVLARDITAQQALAAAHDLVPGAPLNVTIETPSTGVAAAGHARLQIRLRGANRTFVEPTLGLAQRVILRINDVAVEHDGSCWWVDGHDLVLAARLVPETPEPATGQTVGHFSLAAGPLVVPPMHTRRLVETVTVVRADDALRPDALNVDSRRFKDGSNGRPGEGRGNSYMRVVPPTDVTTAADQPPGSAPLQTAMVGPGSPLRAPDHTQLARDGGNLDVYEDPPRPRPTIHQTTPVSRQTPPAGGTVVVNWPNTMLWVPPTSALPAFTGVRGLNTIQVAVYDGAGRKSSDVATVVLQGPDNDLRHQVEQAAYFRWLQRGRPPGNGSDDWLAAEADILHFRIQTLAFQYAGNRKFTPDRALEDWLRAEQAMHLHMASQ